MVTDGSSAISGYFTTVSKGKLQYVLLDMSVMAGAKDAAMETSDSV